MNTTKQTILYSRLSREDERVNELLSIENQKAFLEDYANRSPTQLANELSAEGVLNPSSHWANIGAGMRKFPNQNPTSDL